MIAPSAAVQLLSDLELEDAEVCLAIIAQRILDLERLRDFIRQRSSAPSR
jgi:hypothetical protein